MIKKFKYSLILMTTLALSGCFDKDIKIQKTAISDSGIELTEGFEFQKNVFLLDHSDIAFIDQLSKDRESLENFRKIDFNDLKSLQDYDFDLSKDGQSEVITNQRKKILNKILEIRSQKESQVDEFLYELKKEHLKAIGDLKTFNADAERYMEDLIPLVEEKRRIDDKILLGKLDMKRWSTNLSSEVNEFLKDLNQEKMLKPEHFTKLISTNDCEEKYQIKASTINFYQSVNDFCFMTYIPVNKKFADTFINSPLLSKTIEVLHNVVDEKVKQGEIRSESKTEYQQELEDIEVKLAKAYKKTEKKYNVTRYQLEGKKHLLEDIIERKLKKYNKENDLKFKKVDALMSQVDLNKFKYMMDDVEVEYIQSFRDRILGNDIELEREKFDILSITPNPSKKEVYLFLDMFTYDHANYLDIILVDINGLMHQIPEKIIPIEAAIQTEYLHRYNGGRGVDTISEALLTAKNMLEN